MSALLAALVLAYTPQEAQALFVEANDAYYRQDYKAAIEKYERLLQAGRGGPDVLFNLGTAHLASNELGPAMLYLTRAQRLSNDDDIAAQLAVAQQRQVDQVVGANEAVPFLERVARAINEPIVTVAFISTFWLAFVLTVLWLRREPGRRLALGLVTAVVSVAAVTLGAGVATHAWVAHSVSEAVVMAATAPAREAPSDNGRVSFEVHAGLLVRVMEDTGRFVRIRLPNALEGWVEKGQVTSL
ncbi:MAG: SH3 domain-containing protein [Myxococcaceae bacterium]|nr:SH3 domain-containing protein [Myxococcaceae bacterium]